MSEIKNRDRILEAIDQLRRRKARPDIQRICNFLLRRFSVSSSDTKADLQKCVENDIVLKVEYKGNISYRNAAKKYSHLKRDNGNNNNQGDHHHNSNGNNVSTIDTNKANRKFAALLTNAIAELVVQEPDYLELGVPEYELIKNILSKDNVKYTKKYVSILLEKEVENGGLIKMENRHYLLGNSKIDTQKSDDSDNGSNSSKDKNSSYLIHIKPRKKPGPKPGYRKDNKTTEISDYDDKKSDNSNVRVGSRRKRAKKVFDPSDNNVPKKRGRPAGSLNRSTIEKQMAKLSDTDSRPESRSSNGGRDQGGVCSVCHTQNKKNDRIVACRECSNKAHYSCLNGEDNMMLRMYPDNTWQCPHCKTCVICYETSDAGYLTVCSICADAYHSTCHEPRITEKIKNGQKWLCINCQMPEQLAVNEIQSNIGPNEIVKITHDSREDLSTPSVSGNSSPVNYVSAPPSPTPPALSPQPTTIKHSPHSPDMRCNVSDSQSLKDLDLEEHIDPSIPDASNWTYEDVYNYFAQYFPEEAKVFKEQEIDGHSLLLMKRMDVLSSLKLKLGPALKIYKHVLKLQIRRDDPKLYWL